MNKNQLKRLIKVLLIAIVFTATSNYLGSFTYQSNGKELPIGMFIAETLLGSILFVTLLFLSFVFYKVFIEETIKYIQKGE